jgi:ArsR family transcriptional regulator
MKIATALRALANERRLLILDWLREPKKHFRAQADGDLINDGVCGVLIAEKLGVSAPTLSEHMRVLTAAKLVRAKRIKQWTMYQRNEPAIAAVKRAIRDTV